MQVCRGASCKLLLPFHSRFARISKLISAAQHNTVLRLKSIRTARCSGWHLLTDSAGRHLQAQLLFSVHTACCYLLALAPGLYFVPAVCLSSAAAMGIVSCSCLFSHIAGLTHAIQ